MTSQLNYLIVQQRHIELACRAEHARLAGKYVAPSWRRQHAGISGGSWRHAGSELPAWPQLQRKRVQRRRRSV